MFLPYLFVNVQLLENCISWLECILLFSDPVHTLLNYTLNIGILQYNLKQTPSPSDITLLVNGNGCGVEVNSLL